MAKERRHHNNKGHQQTKSGHLKRDAEILSKRYARGETMIKAHDSMGEQQPHSKGNITAERIRELRDKLVRSVERFIFDKPPLYSNDDYRDLLSILDAHASLLEEVERLKKAGEAFIKKSDALVNGLQAAITKAEAEVRTLKEEIAGNDQAYRLLEAEIKALREEREAARPLLEAVKACARSLRIEQYGAMTASAFNVLKEADDMRRAIKDAEATLAYRKSQEEGK